VPPLTAGEVVVVLEERLRTDGSQVGDELLVELRRDVAVVVAPAVLEGTRTAFDPILDAVLSCPPLPFGLLATGTLGGHLGGLVGGHLGVVRVVCVALVAHRFDLCDGYPVRERDEDDIVDGHDALDLLV